MADLFDPHADQHLLPHIDADLPPLVEDAVDPVVLADGEVDDIDLDDDDSDVMTEDDGADDAPAVLDAPLCVACFTPHEDGKCPACGR